MFLSRLQRSTTMPCHVADDHMPLREGHVYLAAAGHHMLIKADEIVLGNGPAEGRWRPSIDVSLRSAAVSWDSHCVGVILTGMLDDGTAGMEAVQRCGGYTIVQDPNEADYPDMPLSVMKQIEVDKMVRLAAMPEAILSYIDRDVDRMSVPEDLQLEGKLAEQVATSMDNLPQLGKQSLFSCPECGGNLWEMKNGQLHRYRCHIGHSFTEEELLEEQKRATESTLWVALRSMEEKRKLLETIARREKNQGLNVLAQDHLDRARELEDHIERLKQILFRQQKTDIQ
jgi:two-component system chemotaxis response regulator CheB